MGAALRSLQRRYRREAGQVVGAVPAEHARAASTSAATIATLMAWQSTKGPKPETGAPVRKLRK